MNKKELLIEIGQIATKSQLEEILEGLIRKRDSAPTPKGDCAVEDQLKHSFERMEQEFRNHGVHWDQQPESSGHRSSLEKRIEQTLQRCSLGKKGSN